jgi:hypothetical protein
MAITAEAAMARLAGVHSIEQLTALIDLIDVEVAGSRTMLFSGQITHGANINAFDAHMRSLDPAMGLRDAHEVSMQALSLGLEALADEGMPANNRMLIFRRLRLPAG